MLEIHKSSIPHVSAWDILSGKAHAGRALWGWHSHSTAEPPDTSNIVSHRASSSNSPGLPGLGMPSAKPTATVAAWTSSWNATRQQMAKKQESGSYSSYTSMLVLLRSWCVPSSLPNLISTGTISISSDLAAKISWAKLMQLFKLPIKTKKKKLSLL